MWRLRFKPRIASPRADLPPWTGARCIDCGYPVEDNDDAYLCMECGGRNRRHAGAPAIDCED
jgi:hypothetical protein